MARMEASDNDPILKNEMESFHVCHRQLRRPRAVGLIIRVKGKSAPYLFEPLNDNTAVVHFEKGLPDCNGIYKLINRETAAALSEVLVHQSGERHGNSGITRGEDALSPSPHGRYLLHDR